MKKLLFVFLILISGFALSQDKTYKLKAEVTHVEVNKNKISIMDNPIYLDFELSSDFMSINGVSYEDVTAGTEDRALLFLSGTTAIVINSENLVGFLFFKNDDEESIIMYFDLI